MGATSVNISKFLALILRHRPAAANLALDPNGWAPAEPVLAAVQERFGPFDLERLVELVGSNDKRRFVLSEDRTLIRAAQGHSIAVDLKLKPVSPPPFLYHGTTAEALPSIMREGLLRGGRHHVHLSKDTDTALAVGNRRAGQPVVLEVQSGSMSEHRFYLSSNDVWLTELVPPQYLSVAIQGRTGS